MLYLDTENAGRIYSYYSCLFMVLGLAMLITFASVYRLLNTKIHFQFVKMKQQIVQFFIQTFIILVFVIMLYSEYLASDKQWSYDTLQGLDDYCISQTTFERILITLQALMMDDLGAQVQIMFLAVPLVVVTQKSTQDIIEGTSKLDNLLKVSVF